MDTTTAIKTLLERSDMSGRELSRKLGRAETFISTTIGRKSVPQADTLAEIARACGGRLVIRGLGEDIPIDPPASPR